MVTENETVPPLILARDALWQGDDGRALRRGAQSGELIRVRRGVYCNAASWDSAGERNQHLARMRAMAETRTVAFCFSHGSAAALWGLPTIGRWPQEVHAIAPGSAGMRSRNGVVWHADRLDESEIETVDGLAVTGLERTLIDVAKTASFESAVASIDYGIGATVLRVDGSRALGSDRERLLERLEHEGPRRGSARARAAISFSDARSESPGESLSRVQIHRLGYPVPILQGRIERSDGGADYPDFEWEGHFGEFDGHVKYTRQEFTGRRTIEEIVWDEKLREDRLRASGKRVVRWTWREARRPDLLDQRLRSAGMEPERAGRLTERARSGRAWSA